jgi:hypothetical protein
VCGCGKPDTDSDGDGVPDCIDVCPGSPDVDSDGDGTLDCKDGCPNDPMKTVPGQCGCGVPDTDTDGDGVADCKDLCPNDPKKTEPGTCGCGQSDTAGCNEGCSLDYWKTHTAEWPAGYSTSRDFDATFGVNAFTPNITLLQALQRSGGGVNALARQAVAALLNAASPNVAYPLSTQQVIALVQAALAPRGNLCGTTTQLEALNSLGCPGERCVTSSSITWTFNNPSIPANGYIWFSSVIRPSAAPGAITLKNSRLTFTLNGAQKQITVPDATVAYSSTATATTTTYNPITNTWATTVPTSYSGAVFLSGVAVQTPSAVTAGSIHRVTWSGDFEVGGNVSTTWNWAAAGYSRFSSNLQTLNVKPVDSNQLSSYKNNDLAGTPEAFKAYVLGGGCGSSKYVGVRTAAATVGTCGDRHHDGHRDHDGGRDCDEDEHDHCRRDDRDHWSCDRDGDDFWNWKDDDDRGRNWH